MPLAATRSVNRKSWITVDAAASRFSCAARSSSQAGTGFMTSEPALAILSAAFAAQEASKGTVKMRSASRTRIVAPYLDRATLVGETALRRGSHRRGEGQ